MSTEDFGRLSGGFGSAMLASTGGSRSFIWRRNILTILIIMDEGQIDVMVLGFTSNTEPSGLNIRKDDSDQFSKRGWVQGRDSFIPTTLCVASEDAIAADGMCRSLAVLLEPEDC